MDIPVYLFTGFLEAGKTRFIQETLEDPEFNTGDNLLLLLCEEGIEELEPENFASPNVFLHVVEREDQLTEANLDAWRKEHDCKGVVIEYNGMWMLQALGEAMPEEWLIAQEFMFADAGTFFNFNKNMHPLVRDKVENCELIVLNRFKPEYDKMEYHKLIRSINRRVDIVYEDMNNQAELDEIQDPLPFDLNAPVIEIADDDYALWYQDLGEEMSKYRGKTVRFLGTVAKSRKLPPQMFIVGRQMMTCCVEDIRFAGLFCRWADTAKLANKEWITVTAKVGIQKNSADGKPIPVLTVLKVEKGREPEQPVASLY